MHNALSSTLKGSYTGSTPGGRIGENMDRKELVQTYYNEALETLLNTYVDGKVNQETLAELNKFKKIAEEENIHLQIEYILGEVLWIRVLCRLTHKSATFGIENNEIFSNIIERYVHHPYTGSIQELHERISQLEEDYNTYQVYRLNEDNELENYGQNEPKGLYALVRRLTQLIYRNDRQIFDEFHLEDVKYWRDLAEILTNNEKTRAEKDENGNLFFVFSNRKYVFLKNGNPW